jgi:large subunit ribosomal protein L1
MPNPKTGTVTMDVAKAVAEVKAGKSILKLIKLVLYMQELVRFLLELSKLLTMHTKYSNIKNLSQLLLKVYIKSIYPSTMSPAIALDQKQYNW